MRTALYLRSPYLIQIGERHLYPAVTAKLLIDRRRTVSKAVSAAYHDMRVAGVDTGHSCSPSTHFLGIDASLYFYFHPTWAPVMMCFNAETCC